MGKRQITYLAAGAAVAVVGVVAYRAAKGTCGCAKRKSWLRQRGLWPQEVTP
jgi:hypothetical protein